MKGCGETCHAYATAHVRTLGQTTPTQETTLKGSPINANGARIQRASIVTATVSVGSANPRLLRGDGSAVLRRSKTIEAMKRDYQEPAVLRRSKTIEAMKREYQEPAITAVQLQQRTMLLTGSNEVQSFGSSSSSLRYSGSDDDIDYEDAR